MRDARMTRALRRTFDRTACVFRPLSDGTERAVYADTLQSVYKLLRIVAVMLVDKIGNADIG